MPYAKPNKNQANLFGDGEAWREEWAGMPAFEQQNLLPEYSVRVNFASFEDMQKFAHYIGQKLTPTTASIWYPQQQKLNQAGMKYADET
jgi:hypothetical protein